MLNSWINVACQFQTVNILARLALVSGFHNIAIFIFNAFYIF